MLAQITALLLMTSPFAGANPACIAGDPKDLRLVKIFNDTKNPDNAPIGRWRRERPLVDNKKTPVPECRTCRQPYLSQLTELAKWLQRGRTADPLLDNSCVATAMAGAASGVMNVNTYAPSVKSVRSGRKKAAKVAIPPPHEDCEKMGDKYRCATRSFICEGAKSEPETKAGGMPCITADMSDYLTWITNQAMKCLSREDDPIDRRVIFRKLNNESQFLFAVKNKNGMCTQQLIDVAIREMLAPSRGYGEIIKPIIDLLGEKKPSDPGRQRACQAFEEVLKKENTPPVEIGDPPHKLKSCDFLQPGIGIARCALVGIGYFTHVSYTYKTSKNGVPTNISGDAVVRKAGLDPSKDSVARELRDHIALAAYSSAGPGGASDVFEESARSLRCPGSKCTSQKLFDSFKQNMAAYYDRDGKKKGSKPSSKSKGGDKLPNYFKAMDDRFLSLLKKMDGDQAKDKSDYSEAELKGDRCVK